MQFVAARHPVFTALAYGAVAVGVAAAVTGLTQAMGKLSLDACIQRDVPESVRTSAFARSETVLQLGLGGGRRNRHHPSAVRGVGAGGSGRAVIAVGIGARSDRLRPGSAVRGLGAAPAHPRAGVTRDAR